METRCWFRLTAALFYSLFVSSTLAQGTAFTYQGHLTEAGSPAEGIYDLRFTLHDSQTGGSGLGTVTKTATQVSNGVFTATLDFGAEVFDGEANGSLGRFR